MLHPYAPILMAVLVAVGFSLAFVAMSRFFGPHRPTPTKTSVYECGMPPVGGTHQRFSVKFYLVAVLFLLFDLEAVFLFPWATIYRALVSEGNAVFALTEMTFFLGVLFLGWIYCVKRGAFEWD